MTQVGMMKGVVQVGRLDDTSLSGAIWDVVSYLIDSTRFRLTYLRAHNAHRPSMGDFADSASGKPCCLVAANYTTLESDKPNTQPLAVPIMAALQSPLASHVPKTVQLAIPKSSHFISDKV